MKKWILELQEVLGYHAQEVGYEIAAVFEEKHKVFVLSDNAVRRKREIETFGLALSLRLKARMRIPHPRNPSRTRRLPPRVF